ncbi:unnamed protein product [Protopolystoma xenopodis]|uniref:Uncharacterized protein n=1 Tax=Protopolystoma xenopodis TaxID=117903 RepID=A0A3S5A649_9PLAT|nr:unnamed protein product [Protopolystoma xenopodis]
METAWPASASANLWTLTSIQYVQEKRDSTEANALPDIVPTSITIVNQSTAGPHLQREIGVFRKSSFGAAPTPPTVQLATRNHRSQDEMAESGGSSDCEQTERTDTKTLRPWTPYMVKRNEAPDPEIDHYGQQVRYAEGLNEEKDNFETASIDRFPSATNNSTEEVGDSFRNYSFRCSLQPSGHLYTSRHSPTAFTRKPLSQKPLISRSSNEGGELHSTLVQLNEATSFSQQCTENSLLSSTSSSPKLPSDGRLVSPATGAMGQTPSTLSPGPASAAASSSYAVQWTTTTGKGWASSGARETGTMDNVGLISGIYDDGARWRKPPLAPLRGLPATLLPTPSSHLPHVSSFTITQDTFNPQPTKWDDKNSHDFALVNSSLDSVTSSPARARKTPISYLRSYSLEHRSPSATHRSSERAISQKRIPKGGGVLTGFVEAHTFRHKSSVDAAPEDQIRIKRPEEEEQEIGSIEGFEKGKETSLLDASIENNSELSRVPSPTQVDDCIVGSKGVSQAKANGGKMTASGKNRLEPQSFQQSRNRMSRLVRKLRQRITEPEERTEEGRNGQECKEEEVDDEEEVEEADTDREIYGTNTFSSTVKASKKTNLLLGDGGGGGGDVHSAFESLTSPPMKRRGRKPMVVTMMNPSRILIKVARTAEISLSRTRSHSADPWLTLVEQETANGSSNVAQTRKLSTENGPAQLQEGVSSNEAASGTHVMQEEAEQRQELEGFGRLEKLVKDRAAKVRRSRAIERFADLWNSDKRSEKSGKYI